MPWEWVESDGDMVTTGRWVFTDDGGHTVHDARETTIQSSDSWREYETPAVVNKKGRVLERGEKARRPR